MYECEMYEIDDNYSVDVFLDEEYGEIEDEYSCNHCFVFED